MGKLKLKEVESIFDITQVTPTRKLEDRWNLSPLVPHDLPCPPDFNRFLAFLERTLRYVDLANEGSKETEVLIRSRLDCFLPLTLGS
ncbi:unnamed protein product [Penicillium discolor]